MYMKKMMSVKGLSSKVSQLSIKYYKQILVGCAILCSISLIIIAVVNTSFVYYAIGRELEVGFQEYFESEYKVKADSLEYKYQSKIDSLGKEILRLEFRNLEEAKINVQ